MKHELSLHIHLDAQKRTPSRERVLCAKSIARVRLDPDCKTRFIFDCHVRGLAVGERTLSKILICWIILYLWIG
jgi:hypothetical protein